MNSEISFVLLPIIASTADGCLPMKPTDSWIPVEAAGCKRCPKSLISIAVEGQDAEPFDEDATATTGPCHARTFTCRRYKPNIVINNGDLDPVNGSVSGVATLIVTCNAAGTAWENSDGEVIT